MLAEAHSHQRKSILAIILLSLVAVGLSVSTVMQQSSLTRTRAEMATTQANLAQIRADLATTQASLIQTRAGLATTQANLAQTRADLAAAQTDLRTTQTSLVQTQGQLAAAQTQLRLYRDTWGSVVASGVTPPFLGANIVSQANVHDTTWAQLQSFLLADKTDQRPYTDSYVCGDYATDVYNNAERSGIRAAWVAIELSRVWHACNAFKTTDRGLVFIDCTGLPAGAPGPTNRDKIVNVRLGRDYIPAILFPEPGWDGNWGYLGTVLDVQVYW